MGTVLGKHRLEQTHIESDRNPINVRMDLDTQIYIVGGTMAGVLVLVGLLVLILALNVTSLKERLLELEDADEGRYTTTPTTQAERGGARQPQGRQVTSEAQLEGLGYTIYSGDRCRASPALRSQLSLQSELFRGGEGTSRF